MLEYCYYPSTGESSKVCSYLLLLIQRYWQHIFQDILHTLGKKKKKKLMKEMEEKKKKIQESNEQLPF